MELKSTNTSLVYCVGQEVNLTTEVKNADGGTITYKWYAPGSSTAIANETSSSLKLTNIDKSKAGKYKCEIIVEKGTLKCTKTIEIDLVVKDQFSFELGADKTKCNDGSLFSFSPTIQNDNSSIIYNWISVPSGITGTSKNLDVNTNQVTTLTTLTLTAIYGNCIYKDDIKILANPVPNKPSFDYTKDRCFNEIIEFTNTTSGSGLTFKWDFGGGNTSNLINPTYTFPSVFGSSTSTYSVTLEASNNYGCKNSTSNSVVIKQLPDPLVEDNTSNKPFINCGGLLFELNLDNSSSTKSTNKKYEILWGDGTPIESFDNTSFNTTIIHNYSKKGFSDLNVKVQGVNGCYNQKTYSVFNGSNPAVGLPAIGNSVEYCAPITFKFPIIRTEENPSGTTYTIKTNTGKPDVVYSHPPPSEYVHIFDSSSCGATGANRENTFYVSIEAENPCGYSNQKLEPITTSIKPIAGFEDYPKNKSCLNTNVLFTNTSKNGKTVDNFGNCTTTTKNNWLISPSDGWTITSGTLGSATPTNNKNTWGSNTLGVVFNKAGVYNISMIVRNGCGNDTITKPYCVQEPPTPAFSVTPKTGCSPLISNFTNTSLKLNQCDSVVRKWIVTKVKSNCDKDSVLDYRFISGTTDASMHPVIRFNNEGEYSVYLQLTNMCGVFKSASETITVGRKPKVALSVPANVCYGVNVNPSATVQDCGNAITTYKWTFSGGNPTTSSLLTPPNISYNSTGNKSILFEATNLCGTSTDSKSIEVLVPPVVDAGVDKNLCSGETVTIGNSSNSELTYSWTATTGLAKPTDLVTDLSLTNTTSTSFDVKYVVTATDKNTCKNKDSVNIKVFPKPTISISPSSSSICQNTSATLVASGTTTNTASPTWSYTWSPNTSISSTTGATVTVNPSSTITYTVTGSDGVCSNTKTINVTVKELPSITNSVNQQSVCSGAKTSIVNWSSSLTSTYRWELKTNPGNVTGTIANGTGSLSEMTLVNPTLTDQTVVYSVIPASNSCDGSPFNYSILVKPKPDVIISSFTKMTYCGGEKITVPSFSSSVSGTDYQWELTTPKPLPSTISGIPVNHVGIGQMTDLTINNNSSSAFNFTYTIKPIANSCEGDSKNFSFTIFPAPSIQEPFTSSQEICSESNTSVVPFSSATSNVKYVWTIQSIPTGLNTPTKLKDSVLNASGFSIPSFNFINSTINPLDVNIVVKAATEGAATCPGQTKTHKITVNPKPEVTINNLSQLVCHDQSTTAFNFSSTTSSNMIYSWTNSNSSIGLLANGTSVSIPSFVAKNSTKAIVSAKVTVTPIYKTSNATCNGVSKDLEIKVLPLPEVNPISSQLKCPGETTDLVSPSINPNSNTTFSWTLTGDKPNNSSIASGTGDIASVTTENTGSTFKTANYKVTPTFTSEGKSCVGSDLDFTITVLPKPVINPLSNQEKCAQTKNDLVIFTTIPNTGVDIQWQNDIAIGIPASGTGNILATTLTNSTDSPITSTFTATPNFTNAGKTCTGDVKSFTIKVNPIPKVNPITDITLCPNVIQNEIQFTSNVSGTAFSWSNTGADVGISSTSGTGNIASFTSKNYTDIIQTATIKVTPTANTCSGSNVDFKINIKPKPRITTTPLTQEVCSGDKNNEVVWTSSVSSPTPSYTWTSSPMTSGLTISPASGTGNIPGTYVFTNTGTSPISVKFIVKSTVDLCESDPTDYVLTINPRPVLENIDPKVVCSGVPYTSSTFTSNISPVSYSWQVKTTPAVSPKLTGYTNSGTGVISENSVKNADNVPLDLTYLVVPKALGCEGNSKEFVVTINPTPQVSFSIDRQTICNETSNQKVTIASDPAGATISWTATVPSTITGFTTTTGTNEIPVYTLKNTDTKPDSIKIESKANTVGVVCPGATKTHYITVIPKPDITTNPDITKCDNENINDIVFSGTATSFSWENNSILTGLSVPSGTGNIPGFVTTNKGISPIESMVSVTPKYKYNGIECIGLKDEFKIFVNPRPVLNNLTSMTHCNAETFSENLLSSSIATATYEWTNSIPEIGLSASGKDKIPSFKGTNTTDDILTAKIIVTPSYTNNAVACSGEKKEAEYIVKPTAKVTNLDKIDTICSGMFSKNITWSTNVSLASTSFEWKLINNPDSVSGHEINGTGDIKSVKIFNKATSIRKLEYRVKPTFYGCLGDTSFTYTLYINPSASLKGIDGQIICGGSSYSSPTFSSDVIGTNFKWNLRDSLSVPSTINGYLKSGVGTLPSKTIENTGVLPYTLIYDVATDVSGCSGQSIDFNLTVNPAPKVKFDLSNQTICSATNSKLVNLSSVTPDVFFEWKINTVPDSLSGVTKTTGTNQIEVFSLQNKSIKPIDLKITAKAYTKAASTSCYGKDTTFIITTNPVAKVKEVPRQDVCHGSSTNQINLTGTGTSYHWNAKETGFGLSPTNGIDQVPTFTLHYLDTSTSNDFEFYIQPKYTHQGLTCDGVKNTFYIRALPKPIISVASSTICLGKKATLKAEGASINGTYSWSPSTGLSCTNCISPVASPQTTTEYTIIGTNRYTCKDTTLTSVFVNPLPKVYAGSDTTLCNQPIPHIMVGTVEGVEKSGNWSGSPDLNINGIYTPKTNGIYTVVYNFVLPSGCENFDTVMVTVKDVEKSNAGPDLVACFNDPNVTLNGMPKPGTWSGFNVSVDGIFKPIKDTIVNLVYTIGKGTCLNRDTMSFIVQPDFYIHAGPDKEFCFSDSPFDFINQNYEPKLPQLNGEWKGDGITDKVKGTFNPSIAGEGKHSIVFSYTHPTTGCIKSDTLIAEVHPLPIMKFKIDSVVCLNTTQTIQNQTTYLQSSDWTIFPKSKYTDKNPTHKFDSVGFFDIRLIATSPFGCIDSLIKNIEVREGPVARFTRTPDSTCGVVSFVNLSKGIGVTYDWDFGNGDHYDQRDPSDLIYKPGVIKDTTYIIQLRIENLCGVDSMQLPIVVKPVPKIIFAPNVNEGCSVLPITFANKTVGLPDELKWDLYGDGNFLDIRDSIIYRDYTTGNTTSTTYTVKVIAVNECGSDTASTQILVHPNTVKAHFNPDKQEGCTDLPVKFTQYSMGNTFHVWNFGDGTTSKDLNPTHVYTKPGNYTVYLAVNNGCSYDTMRTTIKVYKTPTVDFIKSNDSLCLKNTFVFTSVTNPSDQLSYKWYLGDGDTSVFANTNHTYKIEGVYEVKLKVSNIDNYCGAEKAYKVYVKPRPVAAFEMDTAIGCSPVLVSFKNKSTGANYHSWNFGDGVMSNGIDVNHTFKANLKDTIFKVRLIVENASSCKDTVESSVRVFPVPIMKYSYTPTDQCYTPMYADFTNQSIGAQSYKWFFHDGITSLEMNPRMEYQIAGKYNVKLEGVNEFGCVDSVVHEVVKYIKPKADFQFDKAQGCIPLAVSFKNSSEFADFYDWSFGDGNVNSQKDATNIFKVSGQDEKQELNVRLIVETTNGCKDTMNKIITTFPLPISSFDFTTTDPCYNPMLTTFDNQSSFAKRYEWILGDGTTSTLTNPVISYTKTGSYKVDLITTNKFNCTDTISKVVRMLQKPDAQFSMDKNDGCIPLPITFSNSSQFSFRNYWSFDDGNFSPEVSPIHIFSKVGEHSVQLIVESSDKCKDTISHKITTYPLPAPDFSFVTSNPCYVPMSASFQNNSTGAIGYSWSFGNGMTSTWMNPEQVYTNSGTYKVTLEAVNEYNCKATKSENVIVKNIPTANFSSDLIDGCMPLQVNFFNLSTGFKYSSWDFGDTNTSNDLNSNHTFTKDGTYTIQLVSKNIEGCTDTITKEIKVYPLPVADFGFTNTDPCYYPMKVQLTNKSIGAIGYDWQFSNGEKSNLTHPSTEFNTSGKHLLSLRAYNEYGCYLDTVQFVYNYNPPKIKSADFSKEECQFDRSKFTVEGEYIKKYTWDMGDGIRREGQSFDYAYTKDGLFNITIYAEGEGDCKDTFSIIKAINIKKDPRADFEPINILVEGKKNGTIEFDNKSKFATKFYWDFGDGDTSSLQAPIHKYHNDGNYHTTLITYNQYNCVDTIEMDIHVDFFKGLFVPNAMYIGHQDYEVSHFLPKGVGLFQYEISIYDDWGNLIWRSTAIDDQGRPSEAWDGKYNGEYVQQDSYVWKVDAIFQDNSVWKGKEYQLSIYKRSGTVTVIK